VQASTLAGRKLGPSVTGPQQQKDRAHECTQRLCHGSASAGTFTPPRAPPRETFRSCRRIALGLGASIAASPLAGSAASFVTQLGSELLKHAVIAERAALEQLCRSPLQFKMQSKQPSHRMNSRYFLLPPWLLFMFQNGSSAKTRRTLEKSGNRPFAKLGRKNASVTQEHILKSENIHETIANLEITVLHVPYRFTQEVRREL